MVRTSLFCAVYGIGSILRLLMMVLAIVLTVVRKDLSGVTMQMEAGAGRLYGAIGN